MGQTKRRIDREMEHGYTTIDSRVCNHCVTDKHIRQFIKRMGEESECDYCGKSGKTTVEFNEFIEFLLEQINGVYGNPNDDLVDFEDAESFNIIELLSNLDTEITNQESLRNDIEESLSDRIWCEKYYQYDESDALQAGWEKFAEIAKKCRFTYHQFDDENLDEPIRPSEFLDALSYVISRIGLYKTLTKGTFVYRARTESKKLTKASELAPPSASEAIYPNRMSPSGIPMFYGAFDVGTTIKEIYSENQKEKIFTVAKFKLLKDIVLVDLSKIPPFLNFFEEADYNNQHIDFLNEFAKAISAPIEEDGQKYIDYVPTQIITEHLRYVHCRKNDNQKIYGIIYPSSKSGKKSIVIFCEKEHCVEKGEAKEDSFFELEFTRERNPQLFI